MPGASHGPDQARPASASPPGLRGPEPIGQGLRVLIALVLAALSAAVGVVVGGVVFWALFSLVIYPLFGGSVVWGAALSLSMLWGGMGFAVLGFRAAWRRLRPKPG